VSFYTTDKKVPWYILGREWPLTWPLTWFRSDLESIRKTNKYFRILNFRIFYKTDSEQTT